MSVSNFKELKKHYGHKIVVAKYGKVNAAIECEDCGEVLLDFDKKKVDAESFKRGARWAFEYLDFAIRQTDFEGDLEDELNEGI